MTFVVRRVQLDDLDLIVPLFDAYRQFYGQAGDQRVARQFLLERLQRQESVVFLLDEGSGGVGFVQLYPSFSSTAAARILVLNDLYVAPQARGRGIARALLAAATEYGRDIGAKRLTLSTGADNKAAQRLYEGMDWKRSDAFWTYNLGL